MIVPFDNTFDATFEFHFRDVPKETIEAYCYPGAISGALVHGISLEIIPQHRKQWFASFSAGDLSPNAVSAVVTMPNRSDVLVISRGEAYIVSTDEPQKWQHLSILPVMGWISAAEYGLVLMWDFCRVYAYGCSGLVWRPTSISWDGISKPLFENGFVSFEIWNSPKDVYQRAIIDLCNGSVEGASSSEDF